MTSDVRARPPQSFGGEDLPRLQEFDLEMTRKGLVRKQEYNLPLADTIGRRLYQPEPEQRRLGSWQAPAGAPGALPT